MTVLESNKVKASKYSSISVRMPDSFYQTLGSWIPSILFLLRLAHSVSETELKTKRPTILEIAFTEGKIQSFLTSLLSNIEEAVSLLSTNKDSQFLQVAISDLMQLCVITLTCNRSSLGEGEDTEGVILRQLRNDDFKEKLCSITKLAVKANSLPVLFSCASLLKTFRKKETFECLISSEESSNKIISSDWKDLLHKELSLLLYFSFAAEKLNPEKKLFFDKQHIPLLMSETLLLAKKLLYSLFCKKKFRKHISLPCVIKYIASLFSEKSQDQESLTNEFIQVIQGVLEEKSNDPNSSFPFQKLLQVLLCLPDYFQVFDCSLKALDLVFYRRSLVIVIENICLRILNKWKELSEEERSKYVSQQQIIQLNQKIEKYLEDFQLSAANQIKSLLTSFLESSEDISNKAEIDKRWISIEEESKQFAPLEFEQFRELIFEKFEKNMEKARNSIPLFLFAEFFEKKNLSAMSPHMFLDIDLELFKKIIEKENFDLKFLDAACMNEKKADVIVEELSNLFSRRMRRLLGLRERQEFVHENISLCESLSHFVQTFGTNKLEEESTTEWILCVTEFLSKVQVKEQILHFSSSFFKCFREYARESANTLSSNSKLWFNLFECFKNFRQYCGLKTPTLSKARSRVEEETAPSELCFSQIITFFSKKLLVGENYEERLFRGKLKLVEPHMVHLLRSLLSKQLRLVCPLLNPHWIDQLQEEPEVLVKRTMGCLNLSSFSNDTVFMDLWSQLRKIPLREENSDFPADEVTPELQRLTIQTLTILLLKRGLHRLFPLGNRSNSFSNILPHLPRPKELVFLESSHGEKMLFLRNMIDTTRSLVFPSRSFPSQGNPYLLNIDRIILRKHEQFFHGQLPVEQLRKFSNNEENVLLQCQEMLHIFKQTLEPNKKSSNTLLLRNEVVRSIVFLSDLFVLEDYLWLFKLFKRVYVNDIDTTNDFMLQHYVIIGLCKATAVLHKLITSSEQSKLEFQYEPTFFRQMFTSSLENSSNNISLPSAAIISLAYLVEAGANDVCPKKRVLSFFYRSIFSTFQILEPLLPFLFQYLTKSLQRKDFYTSKPQTDFVISVLSLSFLLCSHYTQASAETSFTSSVIELSVQIASLSTCPETIAIAIYRGFDQLLTTFVLAAKQREKISSFVNEKLSKSNPNNFFLLIGLMVTCMYTSGLKLNEQIPLESEKNNSYMENFERMKILFIKFRESLGVKTSLIERLIPHLLRDFFSVDQILSLMFGEFLKSHHACPKNTSILLFNVCKMLHIQGFSDKVTTWTVMCLNNIIQLRNKISTQSLLWALSCIFVSAVNIDWSWPLLQFLSDSVEGDIDIFRHVSLTFCHVMCTDTELKNKFVSLLQSNEVEVLNEIASLCIESKSKPRRNSLALSFEATVESVNEDEK